MLWWFASSGQPLCRCFFSPYTFISPPPQWSHVTRWTQRATSSSLRLMQSGAGVRHFLNCKHTGRVLPFPVFTWYDRVRSIYSVFCMNTYGLFFFSVLPRKKLLFGEERVTLVPFLHCCDINHEWSTTLAIQNDHPFCSLALFLTPIVLLLSRIPSLPLSSWFFFLFMSHLSGVKRSNAILACNVITYVSHSDA